MGGLGWVYVTSYLLYPLHTKQQKHMHICFSRQEVLRWNGWGYKDSGFCIGDDGVVQFIGKRCVLTGGVASIC